MAHKGLKAGCIEHVWTYIYIFSLKHRRKTTAKTQTNKGKLLCYVIFIFIRIPLLDFSGSVGWQSYRSLKKLLAQYISQTNVFD